MEATNEVLSPESYRNRRQARKAGAAKAPAKSAAQRRIEKAEAELKAQLPEKATVERATPKGEVHEMTLDGKVCSICGLAPTEKQAAILAKGEKVTHRAVAKADRPAPVAKPRAPKAAPVADETGEESQVVDED